MLSVSSRRLAASSVGLPPQPLSPNSRTNHDHPPPCAPAQATASHRAHQSTRSRRRRSLSDGPPPARSDRACVPAFPCRLAAERRLQVRNLPGVDPGEIGVEADDKGRGGRQKPLQGGLARFEDIASLAGRRPVTRPQWPPPRPSILRLTVLSCESAAKWDPTPDQLQGLDTVAGISFALGDLRGWNFHADFLIRSTFRRSVNRFRS